MDFIYLKISEDNLVDTFYSPEVHKNIPIDCICITKELWKYLLSFSDLYVAKNIRDVIRENNLVVLGIEYKGLFREVSTDVLRNASNDDTPLTSDQLKIKELEEKVEKLTDFIYKQFRIKI